MSNPEEDLPYNPNNTKLKEADLNLILKNFDINTFYDINFYRRAFIHKSYITRKNENFENGNINCPPECLPLQEESNERLEFLGDSILNLSVTTYVYDRYPDMNEGFLTNMRTKLVNGKIQELYLASKLNFQKHVVISKQIDSNNGRENKNILEDAFEAFIGISISIIKRKTAMDLRLHKIGSLMSSNHLLISLNLYIKMKITKIL